MPSSVPGDSGCLEIGLSFVMSEIKMGVYTASSTRASRSHGREDGKDKRATET